MPLAVGSDLGSVPIAPAVAETEAGEARHQVELRGPGVADLDRVETDLLIPDDHVLALQPLAHGIVLRHLQADPLVRYGGDLQSAGEVGALGDESFEHEDSVSGEMRGHVLETAHLFVLGWEREEGVVGHEDQGELALDRHIGEVAHRDGDRLSSGLGAQAGDHGRREIDPVQVDPPGRQGEREQPRADAQLQDPAGPGQLRQEIDGGFLAGTEPLIVNLGAGFVVGRISGAHGRLLTA